MKKYIFFVLLFSYVISFGQGGSINPQLHKRLQFENATLISSHVVYDYEGRDNYLEVDEQLNKYNFNKFIDQIIFGSDTLKLNNYTNCYTHAGLYLSQFDSTNTYVKSAIIAQGDSIWSTAMRYFDMNFYVMISYNDKIILQNDTIHSNGSSDVCIIKYDKNFNVVSYVNIGNYNAEGVSKDAFKIANGHIYFAANINGGDSTSYVYENYQINIGLDTLVCDTSYSCSKGEIVLCEMDLNLQPVKTKIMGGSFNNQCAAIEVQNNSVYIIGNTSALTENNIGGIIFNYQWSAYYCYYHFFAKLDENFNGVWVRKFSPTAYATLAITSFDVVDNNIVFIGRTDQPSGCGPNTTSNKLYFENGGYFYNVNIPYEGSFSFMIDIDTLGNFKWGKIIDLYDMHTFYGDRLSSRFLFCSNTYASSIFDTDTIATCGIEDQYLGEINLADGSKKMIATLCGSHSEYFNNITQDPYGKIYVVGKTQSSEITTANNVCYPTFNVHNLFYASLDSFIVQQQAPTGFEDVYTNNTLAVYPNPSNGLLIINANNLSINDKYFITDVTGKIVFENKLQTKSNNVGFEIYLPKLSKGIYLIKFIKENRLLTSKVIIE